MTLLLPLMLLSGIVCGQDKVEPGIEKAIYALTKGQDMQDGPMISTAFTDDSYIAATSPGGDKTIVLTPSDFADAHQAKKFGGQDRETEIVYVDVTDDLIATAKVLAYNERVHYTYYLTFTKTSGDWVIQSYLQRSKMLK